MKEGNKLIALFMGGYINPENTSQWIFPDFYTNELTYHESWDALMPVVEKIGNIHYPNYWSGDKPDDAGEWDDCAYIRTFGMRDDEGMFMVRINANTLVRGKTLIEATWLAVVEFINWYNQQK